MGRMLLFESSKSHQRDRVTEMSLSDGSLARASYSKTADKSLARLESVEPDSGMGRRCMVRMPDL